MKKITKCAIALICWYFHVLNAATYTLPYWSNYANGFEKDHPGDYPFPTEASFASIADHVINSATKDFDPENVKEGDTIFIRDWYLPWFLKYIHPKIKHPYILISNDSDGFHPDLGLWDYDEKNGWPPSVSAIRTLLYDSKIAAWFCKNMLISRHPKITQIPIGPNILYWGAFTAKDYLLHLSEQNIDKQYLLYMNMQLASHPSRPAIWEYFKNKPFCYTHSKSLNRYEFYDDLAKAQFVLAPPGYGPDTVRFWEAIVLNCIPVVKHSELDDLYSDLPVAFVHSWEDIDENFLKKKYEELKDYPKEKAYLDYWAKKIAEIQKKVRAHENDFSTVEATKFSEKTLENLISILQNSKAEQGQLLCKGAIMGLRPFQIASKSESFFKIYVQDNWGAWAHENPSAHLCRFTKNRLIKIKKKIIPLNPGNMPVHLLDEANALTHIFFDLSYLRSNLENDLEEIFPKAGSGMLICGNLADDPYVKEVLERFVNNHNVLMQQKEDIWFFTK